MTRCIAWDTQYSGTKGFDQNNGVGTVTLTNCLSFDNVEGYQLNKATSLTMTNCREFNCDKDELPSSVTVTKITDTTKQATIRSAVKTACSTILSNCENNIITGSITLDIWD
jgi:hypothetical protein